MTAHHLTFFVSAYIDVAEAAGDFDQVERALAASGTSAPFDAAILGRKASGEPRIYQITELPPRADASEKPGAPLGGLAAGLALALIPDMGVGSGIDAAASEQLGIVAGHVARAAGRSMLRDLGDSIDRADAVLVVGVLSDVAGPIRTILGPGHASIERSMSIDVDLLRAALLDSVETSR